MSNPILHVEIALSNHGSTGKVIMALREKLHRDILSGITHLKIVEDLPALKKTIKLGNYVLAGKRNGAEATVEKVGPGKKDGVRLTVRANGDAPDMLVALYRKIVAGEIEPIPRVDNDG